jgi:hypothetical protein
MDGLIISSGFLPARCYIRDPEYRMQTIVRPDLLATDLPTIRHPGLFLKKSENVQILEQDVEECDIVSNYPVAHRGQKNAV